MPKPVQSDLISDGFTTQETGMNDGVAQSRLPLSQAKLLVNATCRGDYVQQRPGIKKLMQVLPPNFGLFQHFGDFRTDAGQQFLIVVAAGRFYRVDPFAKTVLEITITGDPNPSNLRQGWSVQAENLWIYNDGLTLPFIWDGGSAKRPGNRQLGVGEVIFYVQGRLWYALPNGLSFRAGDLVDRSNDRASILNETENDFLNEGGDFSVPGSSGRIVAMAAPSQLDTSQGQGPLFVLGQKNGFSVNTPVDRTIWKNVTYPIQTESLIGAGGTGAGSMIAVNGDLFWRAPDGIRSFIIARRQFRDWGNTAQSFEMSSLLGFDQQDLLPFGSSSVFDNRVLMTLSPAYTDVGVYHRGLAAINLAPVSSIQTLGAPNYDGVWTGLNILAIRQTDDGTFLLVLELDGSVALWQMTKDALFDDDDGRIEWTVIPRSMFVERDASGRPSKTLKKLQTADLDYDQLSATTGFTVSWAPDEYPCYTKWADWEECFNDCQPKPACAPGLSLQQGYQPRKRLPEPPDVCAIGSKLPLRNFYSLNPKLDVKGPGRLLGVRFLASLEQEPKYEPNVCENAPCVTLDCCGVDIFSYVAQGSEGPYGSGSGSGSGSGGGGGGGDLPNLPPHNEIPTTPNLPDLTCPTGDTHFFYGEWTDPGPPSVNGNTHGAGIFALEDLLPGVLEAWAASSWIKFSEFVAQNGLSVSACQIVTKFAPGTERRWIANILFGDNLYFSAFDENWVLEIQYCLNP